MCVPVCLYVCVRLCVHVCVGGGGMGRGAHTGATTESHTHYPGGSASVLVTHDLTVVDFMDDGHYNYDYIHLS